jgi:8-oxo-dGTP pyrophosphatase MutT (NUDIX family)
MREYVVSFLFQPDYKKVWLIQKEKPEWQKGYLNGIGGKVEPGESFKEAALRELKEEAGLELDLEYSAYDKFVNVGSMEGRDFKVGIFAGTTYKTLKTMETEEVVLVDVSSIKNRKYIDNILIMIEASIHRLTDPLFNELLMKYI